MISNGMSIGDIPLDGTITFNRYCKNKCLPEVFFLKKKKGGEAEKLPSELSRSYLIFFPRKQLFLVVHMSLLICLSISE